jgi:hypothetical protein
MNSICEILEGKSASRRMRLLLTPGFSRVLVSGGSETVSTVYRVLKTVETVLVFLARAIYGKERTNG